MTGQGPAEPREGRLTGVARQALAAWGWEDAVLRLIKHRENAVFEAGLNGQRRALRLHRQGYHSDAAVNSELQWMQALGKAEIQVPRVIPDRDGKLFVSREFGDTAGPLQVDLFEWVDGEPLGSVEAGLEGSGADIPHIYFTIGCLAGRLHNQAANWTPPAGFTRHAWDENGLAGEQPIWGRFWELPALTIEERRLMERTRERLRLALGALDKSPQAYSLIHADFAPENLMADGEDVRLIDFDDAGFGWHLFELVTSVYFIMGEDYFESAQSALIEGYRSQRALPEEQLELLPLFFLARATTYLGWVHTRPETETARYMTPMLIQSACEAAEAYLSQGDRQP